MIEFYATVACNDIRPYMPAQYAYMLPASSWQRVNMRSPKLPLQTKRIAADCGGFVATFKWGDYKYTPDEYVTWLHTFKPQWAATMDYCCENEITSGKLGVVKERQQRTSEMARRFWHDYRNEPWQWVVTIQGWEVSDYVRHARELRPLLRWIQSRSGKEFRVGIGTLCARADARMVHQVVSAVATELPGMPLHLWGVKLNVFKDKRFLPNVVSVDSAAWNGAFRSGINERQEASQRGIVRGRYNFEIALPRYRDKFQYVLDAPKQMSLAI